MKEYQKSAKEMLEFIEKSPTCFHAVANVADMLCRKGYQELKETEEWFLEPGQGYYVSRNDSAIIAFKLPKRNDELETAGKAANSAALVPCSGFHMIAAHSDSPTFKIKEAPEMTVENIYVKLNTEKYGDMILSTWLDRALSVAGRVVVAGENGPETKLVNVDKDLLVIPNVAIHMNRMMNKGVEYNPQVDMLPLYACVGDKRKGFMKRIAKAAGVKQEDILAHDLFLYPREKGRIIGENGEFILSPRLDDLQCVYTAVKAYADCEPQKYINVCAVFDNEEVGSGTRQGANSTLLEDTLWRISESLGRTRSEYLQMLAGSFLISADNAHAVHPNHPEKADPTNRPYMNGGIVIKYHGSQKYATDAVSAAKMKSLCDTAKVPCQTFANRSDSVGGSTLGNISTAHVSVSSVDIGLPQLAMHSAVETAGVKDTGYAIEAFSVFYQE